jgi:hypothetical protein
MVEDVENDLREMKVEKWRQKANNRQERGSVVKEATVMRRR